MKHFFRLFIFVVLLLGVDKTFAQDSSYHVDTLGYSFYYTISPAPYTASINIGLVTISPSLFSLDVLDASYSVLLSWSPSTSGNRYNHNFDLSALPSGNYYLNIKDASAAIIQTLPFTK